LQTKKKEQNSNKPKKCSFFEAPQKNLMTKNIVLGFNENKKYPVSLKAIKGKISKYLQININ
jgi:hypothetical protein